MLPYSCDALLYHLPIATGVLIGLNVLAFLGAVSGEIVAENGWVLQWGAGIHPLQWLLSRFMHENLGHLLGNMFFLWAFGLVTEGKLGWYRFLLCYLGIAVGQAAIEQAFMANYDGFTVGSLGASAAIFGLMAMACIWAPANELSVLFFAGWFVFTFEITVGLFAAIYVGMDLMWCLLWGSGAATSILHLMGGAMGAILGVVLLKRGIAECEDWDLFSVWSGDYGKYAEEKRQAAAQTSDDAEARTNEKAVELRRRFDAYLEIGQPEQALGVYRRAKDMAVPMDWQRSDLLRLVTGLHKQKRWADSAPLMAEILQRFPEDSQLVRLKLAQICVVELEKPARALELLTPLGGANLAEQHETLRRKIHAIASRQVADGSLEVDDAQW